MKPHRLLLAAPLVAAALLLIIQNDKINQIFQKGMVTTMLKKQDRIEVPFLGVHSVPDPSQVVTTWDWYFLDQVSSSLIKWNSDRAAFEGLLADTWEISGSSIEFKLKENLRFSDGQALTTKDVSASIKRAVILRKNSHFKPWELLSGCENLKTIEQECAGIQIVSDLKIKFNLKFISESFFLFLACPEGSIWSNTELNLKDKFNPKKFSGAYSASVSENANLKLTLNSNWAINSKFSKRPKEVIVVNSDKEELNSKFQDKNIAMMLDLVRPYQATSANPKFYQERLTEFNTLYYLFRVNAAKGKVPQEFISKLWSKSYENDLNPAVGFLPFPGLSGVNRDQLLSELPEKSTDTIRVGYLENYFSPKFIQFLFSHYDKVVLKPLNSEQYNNSFDIKYGGHDLDFVLAPYVASERYPSVQINFLLEGRPTPYDLSALDQVQDPQKKKELLTKIQKWLVNSQQVVPLVFGRSRLVYRNDIDIGRQPLVDSEIQLWRVNESLEM